HRLYEQSMDRDRHTEVGGPPTGSVPKDLELPPDADAPKALGTGTGSSTGSKSVTTDVGADPKPGIAKWLVLGVLLLGGAGAGIYALTRKSEPEDKPIVDAPKDAAVVAPDPRGRLEIFTVPAGATGTVDGKPFDQPTPLTIVLPAGKAKIHLELPGYLPIDYEYDVTAGIKQTDRQTFAAAPAKLHVTTEPIGATVTLAGRNLGVTPLTREDLSAVKDATLTLSKVGFEPYTQKITLEAGQPFELSKTLKASQKFGVVQIQMPINNWGDVYLNGKNLGQAPDPNFRLPVGVVKLHLKNGPAKVEWDITCTVTEAGPNICKTKQP
ncbi:MAG: PEGA domain-containing protein, partial [Polyangiales bacterium]